MAIEIFHIEWTKIQPFDKAINQSSSQSGGVYMMCRQIGERYKLSYIGMAKDFSKRFSTHRNSATHLISDSDYKKLYVSFGLVTSFEKGRMTHDIESTNLKILESFLINEIKPEGNDASTKKGYKGEPIVVFNHATTLLKGVFKKEMTNSPDLLKFLKKFCS
jgi:predicted GIY-YIG superfamily endonuclease